MIYKRYLPGYIFKYKDDYLYFSKDDYYGYIGENKFCYTYKCKSYKIDSVTIDIDEYANFIIAIEEILVNGEIT